MLWKKTDYTGWGRALTATGEIARPERRSTLDAILKDGLIPAIGMRRSYGDACLNHGGRAIDMSRLDRMLSFDAKTGILDVEAGARVGEIAAAFAPKGWLPAVMPGTGFATVGGCIAQDVHGKNHHNAGSFCQHVASLTLLTAKGPVEVSPEKTPALFRATAGGLGQTGVIVSARLKLLACKGDVMVVTERRIADWDEFLARLDASDATYTVGWIDATATGRSPWPGHSGRGGNRLGPHPAAPHLAQGAVQRPAICAFGSGRAALQPRLLPACAGNRAHRGQADLGFLLPARQDP